MVVDAVRTYLDAANGLTELSRKQAVAAAKTLLRANGATPTVVVPEGEAPPRVGQSIQTLAGELIETSQANRAAVAELVRSEVRGALEQMDMVPRAEYERMVRRVAELERRMAARHAVERVLEPRGGASSELPVEEKAPVARVEPEAAEEAPVPVVPETAPESGEGESAPPEAAAEETAAVADGDGAKGDDSGNQAPDGAAKPKPRTTRTRSTAKRTNKGKGAKK
ncbi:membrane fusogenic activity family protein [Nocardiopsis sp. NPDC058789]|uniref:membrane fusogenic activity family protein n=1 Tax=Nocardiopsis TaxID=2013 RepID=UPI00366B13EF